jgi:fermentation-respiration switch protein FrsA (DUF1100 family)
VARILSPVLFLSGGADEMVPQWHMRLLHQTATSPKSEWCAPDPCSCVPESEVRRACAVRDVRRGAHRKEFPTGRHMDMYQVHQEEYWQTVNAFLEKHGCFVWN